MSEPSEVFGISEEDSELDFDAIFGGSAETPSDPLPFPEPPQSAPADETPEAADAAPVTETIPAATAPTQSAEKNPEAEQDLFAAFSGDAPDPAPQPEAEQPAAAPAAEKQVSLFDKPAIFKYGSAKEPIDDASMTFEEDE